MDVADYYDILGIDPSADPEQVRTAFRRVAAQVHPDAGGTCALFRQVHHAYETLSDPVRRAAYDEVLAHPGDGPRTGPGDQQRPHPDRTPGWTRVDDGPPVPGSASRSSGPARPGSAVHAAVTRQMWFSNHPSLGVTLSGALAIWLGLVTRDGLVAVGALAVAFGTIGLTGSGRARAHEATCRPDSPTNGARRFGSDLRFGVPMVCRSVVTAVAVLVLRSEFRRATGSGRR